MRRGQRTFRPDNQEDRHASFISYVLLSSGLVASDHTVYALWIEWTWLVFREFLGILEKRSPDAVAVAQCFLDRQHDFIIYSDYCTNFPRYVAHIRFPLSLDFGHRPVSVCLSICQSQSTNRKWYMTVEYCHFRSSWVTFRAIVAWAARPSVRPRSRPPACPPGHDPPVLTGRKPRPWRGRAAAERHVTRYHTIWYGRLTCAQKLTRWPA